MSIGSISVPTINKVDVVHVYSPLYDKDGNQYHQVTIGSQIWTVENLMTTKYSDGSSIFYGADPPSWASATIGMYCFYDDDIGNRDIYGALYNWYAVNDVKGLVYFEQNGVHQTGWRIPTTTDWNNLITFVGSDSSLKLRETGYAHWIDTIIPHAGLDTYGFRLRGAGQRSDVPDYGNLLYITNLWHRGSDLKKSYIMDDSNDVLIQDATWYKNFGLSVRCVKDL